MRRRTGRAVLVGLWLVAVGAAGYSVVVAERQGRAVLAARAAFDEDAWQTTLAIAHLEAAARAAVATGQSSEYWLARATASRREVERGIETLRATALSPEAQQAVQHAQSVLHDFDTLDRRAREHLGLDQRLLASDLIFADGGDMLRAAARDIETARQAEAARTDTVLAETRRRQAAVAAAGAAATLLVVLLLLPARAAPPAKEAEAPGEATPSTRPPEADQEIGAALDARLGTSAARSPAPAQPEPTPSVDWAAAAALCTAIARVADTRELPPLIGRAAQILGASGAVLWIADPASGELVPAIAHGYAPETIARLGTVSRDADNATAAAYRAARTLVVPGEADRPGALIAPLVTVSGCGGVMAAELPHPREQDALVRATAEILAAQFATLVAPAGTAASRVKSAPA